MAAFMALLSSLFVAGSGWAVAETLPGPVVHPYSFELLSNSRYSVHSGFSDSLPRQVMANVLWAMNQVPRLGQVRQLYVATKQGVYRYEPEGNVLVPHKSGDHRYSSTAAFEVGIATDRQEEAGMAVQAGLLAGTAFADSAGPGVASCPMKWAADNANSQWNPDEQIMMVDVFGRAAVKGLDTSLVAVSSDSSLPRPRVNGPDTFELTLMNLSQDSLFSPASLSLETVSQLLWAGYGTTPHLAYDGRRGLTVPSAVASYYLTGRIYLVREEGVDRYRDRPPSAGMDLSDHRVERIVTGDRRFLLRQASTRIPSSAPAYIVVCVNDTGSYGPMQEAGFAAFQYLAQARTLGLGGFVTASLNRDECRQIATALGLPSADVPALVFSVGEIAAGIGEPEVPGAVEIVRASPVLRPGEELQVDYLLRQTGTVRVEIYDMLGRPIRRLLDARQSAGPHSVTWDGLDANGERVKIGSYVVGIFSHGSVGQHKVAVF
jgi:hypothetical protein